MSGGLMQLVAYGAQDVYLTGNPQITFFKVVYRRHTNFSIECIEQTVNGTPSASGGSLESVIKRNGDLVGSMHFDVKMSNQNADQDNKNYLNWTNNTGHAFIKEVSVEIGGQRIDRHYGHWLDVYNELTDHDEKEHMILNKHTAISSLKNLTNGPDQELQLYIPLKFWFNRNPGLALPLIALQYHRIKLKFVTRSMLGLINGDGDANVSLTASAPSIKLWANYYYLDTEERKRFAKVSHEYLIEQVQHEKYSHGVSHKLKFNHPVKELIWVEVADKASSEASSSSSSAIDITANVPGSITQNNDYFNYDCNDTTNGDSEFIYGSVIYEAFATAKITLNGQDRFEPQKASYFRLVQPLQAGHKIPNKNVYVYSFALRPEEHQPSGTCNFSRLDNAKLEFTSNRSPSGSSLHIYAINYNVLRIMSGMGGLAYSN